MDQIVFKFWTSLHVFGPILNPYFWRFLSNSWAFREVLYCEFICFCLFSLSVGLSNLFLLTKTVTLPTFFHLPNFAKILHGITYKNFSIVWFLKLKFIKILFEPTMYIWFNISTCISNECLFQYTLNSIHSFSFHMDCI